MARVAWTAVTTLEGLAKTGRDGAVTLHSAQQTFVGNPLQCG
ncbi:hypothetical protein [Deinococcus saxicola]